VLVPQTVVIVDDHAGFRKLAARLIDASGYEVIGEAANGEDAIDAVRRLQPDVLLLDVQLPDLDGFRVASELAGGRTTIILTSSREAGDYTQQLAQTEHGFISKRDLTVSSIAQLIGPPSGPCAC
jgi:DNA-binding NarL/FixJ family response regulator